MKIKKIERIPNDLVEEMYWPPAADYHVQISFGKEKLIVFRDPEGNGSGIFATADGWILTEASAQRLIGATVRHLDQLTLILAKDKETYHFFPRVDPEGNPGRAEFILL